MFFEENGKLPVTCPPPTCNRNAGQCPASCRLCSNTSHHPRSEVEDRHGMARRNGSKETAPLPQTKRLACLQSAACWFESEVETIDVRIVVGRMNVYGVNTPWRTRGFRVSFKIMEVGSS